MRGGVGCVALAGIVAASLAPGVFVALEAGAGSRQDRPTAIDRAFQAFWSASNRAEAASRIDAVLRSGVTFDDALARIRRGRDYSANVPRGRQIGRHRTSVGLDHHFAYAVPENYDPQRPYQLRVQLHGGVGRPRPPAINRIRVDALPGSVEEIAVFPTGWAESMWWSASQMDNLSRILDRLKRTYNVDENRVYLTGSSDGGTGVYFAAFKDTTPWASFLPLITDMMVLSAPAVRADGDIFPGNAVNKPLFIVNAGRDRLYPAHVARIHVDHLKRLGASAVFRVYPESDHSTAWWPEERAEFEAFVHDHPREPLPDAISWQTDRTDRYNRAHWLVIDRLGSVDGESALPDSNLLQRGRELDFGLRIDSAVDRGRHASQVLEGSNAFRLGLRAGDRFVEVNGVAIESGRDIAGEMQKWNLGDRVRVTVARRGDRHVLEGVFEPTEIDVPAAAMFPRKRPSGRVDLIRRGNVVEASTQGVRAFTLLLSPSIFDFQRPIRVVANGRTVYEGVVEPSVEAMLKWAARDDDRTMVFGAELAVDLAETPRRE